MHERRPGCLPASRAGFTVFELLVTLLLITIVISIGMTNLSTTIDKTSDAAAVADLRNAMTAQEAYRVDHEAYGALTDIAISTSTGVEIGGGASAQGYRITARHARSEIVYAVSMGGGGSTEGSILPE